MRKLVVIGISLLFFNVTFFKGSFFFPTAVYAQQTGTMTVQVNAKYAKVYGKKREKKEVEKIFGINFKNEYPGVPVPTGIKIKFIRTVTYNRGTPRESQTNVFEASW